MSVKRNIFANFVGQGVASVLSLLLVPVYIHYLSIEAYALVGLYGVIQVWLTLLDLGMTPTLNREMARFSAGDVSGQAIKDLLRSLEIVVGGLAIVIALALTAASGFLATDWLKVQQLPVEEVARGLSLVGVVVGLRFCEGIYRSGIIGLQQQVWLNVAGVLLAVLRGVGAIGVLMISPTIQAFFQWQAFISIVTLVVMGAKLHLALPPTSRAGRFSVPALMEVRHFAGGMLGMTVLAVLLTQVDKLLLSRLLPLDQFGYYMLASTVAAGVYLAVGPVIQAVFPRLVALVSAGNPAPLARAYHEASQAVSVLLVPISLMLAAFPRGVLYAWSGDPVLAARTAPILGALAIGTCLNALMQVPHHLQLAIGWTSLALKMNIVAVIVLIPALLVAVPLYGPVAAAIVWIILNSGYLLVGIPLLHRRLLPGEMRAWVVGDVLLPAAGTGLAILLVAQVAPPAAGDSRLVWLGFLSIAGTLAAIGSILGASTIRTRAFDAINFAINRRRRA